MSSKKLKTICVFCGSNPGNDPAYLEAAIGLGKSIVAHGYKLVYGGAEVGLMGAVADAALKAGGHVIGVMPRALVEKEIAHKGLTELLEVSSMHERKALMADLSDGFIALPGGVGTLEEIFEIWTWAQLGHHDKPLAFMNVSSFYDPLGAFLDHQSEQGFVRKGHRDMAIFSDNADEILTAFVNYDAPELQKWVERAEI
ncbi:TIGR00730 family Rossman fold protein [Pararhizobium sp. IMCC21322]|uniref:LOG family protein n=1 Tax=Pararhizobium sp. IMCC21322 TaxID=3067903 RepID=UPI002742659A|nr:TIGR00730 family Rossman fold protein [Pararhizobium sp. IMCC21322]